MTATIKATKPMVLPVSDEITPAEFKAVAKTCTRWEPRSLEAVRMLLVDGATMATVAKAQDMSIQQVSVLRKRFMAKLPEYRLSAFTKRVPPKGKPSKQSELQKKGAELEVLEASGYTHSQMVEYLAEHNIKATAAEIRKQLQDSKQ